MATWTIDPKTGIRTLLTPATQFKPPCMADKEPDPAPLPEPAPEPDIFVEDDEIAL